MSDEFNVGGRTFDDGHDPIWTSLEKNDYTNDALHFYSKDNTYTDSKGNLIIKTEFAKTVIVGFDDVSLTRKRVTKRFKSSMLQSWNKFCFTGGIIETEAIFPGDSDVAGLWPAFW
jgi:beta-glucanase (GH16 family)